MRKEVHTMPGIQFSNYGATPWKRDYILDKKEREKRDKHCVICQIVEKDKTVPSWELHRNSETIIFLNRFPYLPGHALISPIKHYEDYAEMPDKIVCELALTVKKTMKVLSQAYPSKSFSFGVNSGESSGRSIKHIHYHVIPRYRYELGFIDLIGTRVLFETVDQTLERLKPYTHLFSDKKEKDPGERDES